eukprot:1484972-Amphidinium_carterae.1
MAPLTFKVGGTWDLTSRLQSVLTHCDSIDLKTKMLTVKHGYDSALNVIACSKTLRSSQCS